MYMVKVAVGVGLGAGLPLGMGLTDIAGTKSPEYQAYLQVWLPSSEPLIPILWSQYGLSDSTTDDLRSWMPLRRLRRLTRSLPYYSNSLRELLGIA